LANGDLHLLGTFYKAGVKQLVPTNPWRSVSSPGGGNIPVFSAGQTLEIRDTDPDSDYQLRWREVNIGSKKLLIADRNILEQVSWDDLNAQGLIFGKEIMIDGKWYKLRVLTGGEERREGGTGTSYEGAKLPNEWDDIIVNEGNYPGLPKPSSTDLDNNLNDTDKNSAHNQFWNWYYMYSWMQDTYLHNNSGRATRGHNSPRHWNWQYAPERHYNVGWRPVLEVLNYAPETLSDLPVGAKVKDLNTKYYGEPIVFQVAAKNHEGYPTNSVTLITERIITLKAFDAKEPSNSNSNRRNYGNNRYLHSNIRQWLNKDSNPWYVAQHEADQAPNAENLWNSGYNPYDNEDGFLANFSPHFKNRILTTTLTVANTGTDGGGSETVQDKVFLPSRTEVGLENENNIAEGSKWQLFTDYLSRKVNPTPEAVSNSTYENSNLSSSKPWRWLLRTPYTASSYYVRHVHSDGGLNDSNSYDGSRGIRPALNLPSDIRVSSTPDSDGAYIIQWNEPPTTPGTFSNPTSSTRIKRGTSHTVSWGASSDPDGNVTHYQLDFYNGSSWTTVSSSITGTSYTHTIPSDNAGTTGAKYRVRAKDNIGDWGPYRESSAFTITTNSAPNAPTTSFGGTSSASPARVSNTTPTVTWTFSDPDGAGETQSAFQVLVKNGTTTVHDSGKVISATQSYTIPSGIISAGTIYNVSIRTWDQEDEVGAYSPARYIIHSTNPTITSPIVGGISVDSGTPTVNTLKPRVEWTYSQAQGYAQKQYRVYLYDNSNNALVRDSGLVASANKYYDIPDTLVPGKTYKIVIYVYETYGGYSSITKYFKINETPPAPTTNRPLHNQRTPLIPTFNFTIGDDVENNNQHFRIQVSTVSNFSSTYFDMRTDNASERTFFRLNGSAFPSGGATSAHEGLQVTFTPEVPLVEGTTYYWRVAPIDVTTGAQGDWSSSKTLRAGNMIEFTLHNSKRPTLTERPFRVLVRLVGTIATDGDVPATIRVYATNNAFDSTPTWEDMTESFLEGQYYEFKNNYKTASNWGINVRVEINAQESLGTIELTGFGIAYD